MYIDAADRKINDPIDYLIEAEKKARKLQIPLAMSGHPELADEARVLYQNILSTLNEQPIEAWETAKHTGYANGLRETIKTQ